MERLKDAALIAFIAAELVLLVVLGRFFHALALFLMDFIPKL